MVYFSLLDKWIGRSASKIASDENRLVPTVVITGGSSGIGLAIAKRFARAGHRVALIGRDESRLRSAANELANCEGTGTRVILISVDVSQTGAPEQIAKQLADEDCYLDILVNNAGLGLGGGFSDQDADQLDALVSLNVAAVTRLTRHFLPELLARGRGGILNIASLGGLMPGPYQAAYYASKAYVVSLTRAIASETGGRGVRVACVLPGAVETRFHAEMGANNAWYRYVLPSMSPESVAASVYRGYWLGHRLIVPGTINWLLSRLVPLIPYNFLVPLMGWLLWPGNERKR